MAATDDAVIVIGPEGSYEDASEVALDLLGVSRDEFRALPPGSLSTLSEAEAAPLREEWERQHPDAAMGRSVIKRPDGTRIAVSFVLRPRDDGRWEAVLRPVAGMVSAPRIVFTVGHVLSEWRAAERRLEELHPDSPDWESVRADIELFRAEYRRLFETQSQSERA